MNRCGFSKSRDGFFRRIRPSRRGRDALGLERLVAQRLVAHARDVNVDVRSQSLQGLAPIKSITVPDASHVPPGTVQD